MSAECNAKTSGLPTYGDVVRGDSSQNQQPQISTHRSYNNQVFHLNETTKCTDPEAIQVFYQLNNNDGDTTSNNCMDETIVIEFERQRHKLPTATSIDMRQAVNAEAPARVSIIFIDTSKNEFRELNKRRS